MRSEHTKYDDRAPVFRNNMIHINFDSGYIKQSQTPEVTARVTSFLEYLNLEDISLREYNTQIENENLYHSNKIKQ